MEALAVDSIPEGPDWQYEPKWDGFRCLVFRRADAVRLQSKSGQPLARYFPELVEALLKLKPKNFVLDGEIVVPGDSGLSFDALLQRIHPAASRIAKLSQATPACLMIFDILENERKRSLVSEPLSIRRPELEKFASKYFSPDEPLRLSPATSTIGQARRWFDSAGPTLDGIIAKRLDLPYQSGNRLGMLKIKKIRSADCVVGGFRYATGRKVVGSLLLGLYDDAGLLHHVGFTSGLRAADRPVLTKKLEASIHSPGFTGRAPGGPSRWSTERSAAWKPLAPRWVVEVTFDHVTGKRFRHGARLLRWRPEKDPHQCTLDHLGQPVGKDPLHLRRGKHDAP
jgi:ATP-dependent DNA ligase